MSFGSIQRTSVAWRRATKERAVDWPKMPSISWTWNGCHLELYQGSKAEDIMKLEWLWPHSYDKGWQLIPFSALLIYHNAHAWTLPRYGECYFMSKIMLRRTTNKWSCEEYRGLGPLDGHHPWWRQPMSPQHNVDHGTMHAQYNNHHVVNDIFQW